ncbi:MAG: hypothetical protein HFJ17_05275 [Clostridia bacterium]|nr:hypothetical protein [Clostridia bacterium]
MSTVKKLKKDQIERFFLETGNSQREELLKKAREKGYAIVSVKSDELKDNDNIETIINLCIPLLRAKFGSGEIHTFINLDNIGEGEVIFAYSNKED